MCKPTREDRCAEPYQVLPQGAVQWAGIVQLEHFVSRRSVGGVQKGAAGTGWIEETLESALCGAQWLRAPQSWRHVVGGRTLCAPSCLSRA
jgi:hypothetical protein